MSASRVKRNCSLDRCSLTPPFPKLNDSKGFPRYGGSKASFSVRLVAILDSSWSASRMLLLPAALGPNSTDSCSNVVSTSPSDL